MRQIEPKVAAVARSEKPTRPHPSRLCAKTEGVVRRRYSEVADVYIRKYGAVDRVDPADLEFVRRNLVHCDGTVLDAGCGPGHLTAYLTGLGLSAIGIDLVPEFINNARSKWPEIEYAVGSLHTLGLPERCLGGILAWYSLIHCGPVELGFFDGDEVEPFDHKVTTAYRWPTDEMSRMLSLAGFVEFDRARRAGSNGTRPHAALAARAN